MERTSGLRSSILEKSWTLFTLTMQYLTVFCATFLTAFAFETDLTVDVGPGKMECFFQTFKKPTGLEIEYQVAKSHCSAS